MRDPDRVGSKLLSPDGGKTETPVHMAEQVNLYWDSKEDIRSALVEARSKGDWDTPGRLVPWIFSGGVQLPRYLNGFGSALEIQSKRVSSLADLSAVDSGALLSALTSEAARAMF